MTTDRTNIGAAKKCYRSYFRDTAACKHWLRECLLCQELTFCEKHGCSNCNQKHRDDFAALSATPDAERKILVAVSQRTKSDSKPRRKSKRIKKYNHRDRYLDDLIASNS